MEIHNLSVKFIAEALSVVYKAK